MAHLYALWHLAIVAAIVFTPIWKTRTRLLYASVVTVVSLTASFVPRETFAQHAAFFYFAVPLCFTFAMLQILDWGRFARLAVDVFDESQTDEDLQQFSPQAWLRVARRYLLTRNGSIAGVELAVAILWVFITSQAVGPVIAPVVFVLLGVEIGYLLYLRDQAVKVGNYSGSLVPAATWPGNRHDIANYPFYERAMINHIHLSILLWLGRLLILAAPTDVAYGAFGPSITKDIGLILFFACYFVVAATFVRFVRGPYVEHARYVSVGANDPFAPNEAEPTMQLYSDGPSDPDNLTLSSDDRSVYTA